MAEVTVLRGNAINRSSSPNASGKPHAQLSGPLPVVQVNMNAGGPQIRGGQSTAKQGVTILPPKGAVRNFSASALPNQLAKQGAVATPATALTADQLLFCRHLADKYLGELRSSTGEAQVEGSTADNIKVAEATLTAIDAVMIEMTTAAAIAAAATVTVAPVTTPPPRAVAAGPRSPQAAASGTPRRVARPAPPPVIVAMDAGQPIVQTDPVDLIENDAQG